MKAVTEHLELTIQILRKEIAAKDAKIAELLEEFRLSEERADSLQALVDKIMARVREQQGEPHEGQKEETALPE
jgi:peptidoglycan hydrolase CwlO-like protein